ncbi:hypothetical protein SEMRO_1113_G242650.1 [Seminavis robusta]|uniref:Uncharacterized protein n=1 Tax=Seminavis robusta TaxID=568900 RepID=A0A9N8EFF8_9STRA|nr:hypothetical protein SEMRO_1113_G242650.1 [Seminavis robusta]|eukprot:Sro1113_g242650.1 n/a (117) ;mRNA; f:19478-19828
MIKWKQGPSPTAPYDDNIQKSRKNDLVQLWQTKYALIEEPCDDGWTSDDSEELQRLRDGTIFDFEDEVGLTACFDNEDQYLTTSLLNVDKDRRRKVLLKVLQSIDSAEADGILEDV